MLQPGQQIEIYRIDDVISEGGMGTVYRATDVNLMRPVAVKVMHGELSGDPAFRIDFFRKPAPPPVSIILQSSASITSAVRKDCSTS